jgi:hypothetical protein
MGTGWAELPTPLPDGFVGHDDAAGQQQFCDVPIAEAEAGVEPDAVADRGARWLRHQAVLWWITTDRFIEICSQRV